MTSEPTQGGKPPDTDKVNPASKKGVKGFLKGRSGNPRGRPPGSRNKASLALDALLESEVEEIGRVLIEKAKAGDMAAIKLVLKYFPPRRSKPVQFYLRPIESFDDLGATVGDLLIATARGNLTPDESSQIFELLKFKQELLECKQLVKEVADLRDFVEHGKPLR